MSSVVYFDPPCAPPDRFPSPFASTPHPIAQAAAAQLLDRVRDLPSLAHDGKMFGVLVVADRDGRIGALHAFSGMLDGRWRVDGFVPPLFDEAARDAVWPDGEAELARIAEDLGALDRPELATGLAQLDAAHENTMAELRARHLQNRAQRRMQRTETTDPDALHALDQLSRKDAAEKARLVAAHEADRAELAAAVAALAARRDEVAAHRAERSRFYLHALFDTYALANARGDLIALRTLFTPEEPPGGAGDCAAPKLLGHAYRAGLRPLAIAELWWGAPPATGGRHAGVFYPACRGKCGPILAHMIDGLDADPAPQLGSGPIDPSEPAVVFEDDWLVIVNKPVGLLSVPGRHAALRDSVQTRMVARYGAAYLVHRLDLDASGLLLIAKDRGTHAALQRLFARREIDKRYIAWLDGIPAGSGGTIALALRGDFDDRPRQIHDPVHGKHAVTEWRVLEHAGNRTRVELFPRTGRAHQLRVHAAHPRGIGAAIVGDRLYGREGDRLCLHAEALSFVHPHTKNLVKVERRAPF